MATQRAICRLISRAAARTTLLRPLSAVRLPIATASRSITRYFSSRHSQVSDSTNFSNRPPKETILLDGCDFEHWLVVVDPPPEDWTRHQIIDFYVKTLATVVGSEEEARRKIYSVSTKHYFAFGALVSEELSNKIKDIEKIRWVLPDSYLDVKNKDYGGEPFIDGQAAPYDPKYHEEWVRNNGRERPDRNRTRNPDRGNFDRNRGTQNFPNSPAGNRGGGPPNQHTGPPNNPGRNMTPGNAPYAQNTPPRNPGYQQNAPPHSAGYQQNAPLHSAGYQQNAPPHLAGYQQNAPPHSAGYQQNAPPNNAGYQQNAPPHHAGYQQNVPPNNAGYQQNMPPNNTAGYGQNVSPNNAAGYGQNSFNHPVGQVNPAYINNSAPNYDAAGGMPYQNNTPNAGYQRQTQNVPGRDMP